MLVSGRVQFFFRGAIQSLDKIVQDWCSLGFQRSNFGTGKNLGHLKVILLMLQKPKNETWKTPGDMENLIFFAGGKGFIWFIYLKSFWLDLWTINSRGMEIPVFFSSSYWWQYDVMTPFPAWPFDQFPNQTQWKYKNWTSWDIWLIFSITWDTISRIHH